MPRPALFHCRLLHYLIRSALPDELSFRLLRILLKKQTHTVSHRVWRKKQILHLHPRLFLLYDCIRINRVLRYRLPYACCFCNCFHKRIFGSNISIQWKHVFLCIIFVSIVYFTVHMNCQIWKH